MSYENGSEVLEAARLLVAFFDGEMPEESSSINGCCVAGCNNEAVYFDSANLGFCVLCQEEPLD